VVNSALYENIRVRLGQDEHATFCLLRYYEDGRMVCTGAHEDILIYRANSGRCDEVRLDGVWVGIMPELGDLEQEQQLRLSEGDIVLLYTDGVTEARDVNGRMFGVGRLKEELARVHRLPAAAICRHLLSKVKDFMSLQHDDISLLVARYCGGSEKSQG
jgi:serine phosphatase RsbU (regulator of sigma subunit)